MKPITLPRTIALVVVAVLVGLTEEVGPNRLWISGILVFIWAPFMIWRDTRPSGDEEEWREVFLNVLLVVVLVNFAPAMWHIAVILGAMIVQAPATVAQPRGFKLYALVAGVFVAGMAVSGYLHNPPMWKLTLGCVLGMYPAILLFAHWQARRHQTLQARGAALDSIRLMASGVAHDFNNYLTGIIGNAELARANVKEQPPSQSNQLTYQALDNVVRGTDKARELARQLLSFSRAESPIHSIVDLGDELLSLTELLEGFGSKRSTIEFVNNDSQPRSLVSGSPVLLQQLFMNLIINAMESTDQEVVVGVGVAIERVTRNQQSMLEIAVTDDGEGIAQSMRERMFEPFVTSKASGYGLGLAAAKEIVHKHGGEIEVDSEEGRGTRVRVWLPT